MRFSALILATSLALVCHALHAAAAVPRVRREIRAISDVERQAMFDALLLMKSLPTADGRKKFGPRYWNYDDLLVRHLDAAADARCDQGHLGPAFAVFHRAFVLQAEQSLMAIDARITAMHYWDYNIDLQNGADPRQSVIWSDAWFGASVGDASDGHAVHDGYFARRGWRVRAKATDISKLVNPFGFLRGPWNNNSSPFLTRFDHHCNSQTTLRAFAWNACLDPPSYLLWYACIDPTVHTMAHSFLGGIWHTAHDLIRDLCFATYAVAVPANWKSGCLACPTACTTSSDCACTVAPGARCVADHAFMPVPTYGDFSDVWTSPNDPIFFFHHSNVDRHLLTWQLKHAATEANQFAGFPSVSLPCSGHGLHDVISSSNPFRNLFDDARADQPLTHFDVLNRTSLAQLYTFDSLLV